MLTVDPAATDAERRALVELARSLSGGLSTEVVRVDIAPIRFETSPDRIDVSTPGIVTLSVTKAMAHDPSCGAMQWF